MAGWTPGTDTAPDRAVVYLSLTSHCAPATSASSGALLPRRPPKNRAGGSLRTRLQAILQRHDVAPGYPAVCFAL
ncbi:hypothetical protein BN77_p40026 [Rhizobium mesoamericanum STM3625]|uniref:Uncharacterized protein n=1 Tax=Rhizobium mesoamericanum STM3625 TaxID=1211777 RepID=K0Q6F5_9HYPH|nr:hypothetical protein BN77_p40026 [Rhizobium mesoamericanum STM3625]